MKTVTEELKLVQLDGCYKTEAFNSFVFFIEGHNRDWTNNLACFSLYGGFVPVALGGKQQH